MSKIKIIDLFCGAGGLSTGASMVEGVEVIACVNHDEMAIESHKANHPSVLHFTEDVRDRSMIAHLRRLVENVRNEQPGCFILVWASLECTNFSKAKGGLPRDADSRTLADYLYYYIEQLDPDGLWIENVIEFMAWGPLDKAGKPISRDCGIDYVRWRESIKFYGYEFEWKELNAADYGAVQSRKRYFAQFVKHGLPIAWPKPTHSKNASAGAEKWKPVRQVLDFEDKGTSIFTRKKPLVENTLKRIYAGLVKYVAGGDDSFIQKHFSGRPMGKVVPTNGPAGTITTSANQSLIQCAFIAQYNGGGDDQRVHPIENPLTSVSTNGRHAVVQPIFLYKYYGHGHNLASLDDPSGTVTTKDRLCVVWIDKQFGGDANHQSINQPAGSILVNDKHCVMNAFMVKSYSGGGQHQSIDSPSGSILTVPKENLVQVESWLLDTSFSNTGKSIEQPAPTVLASRKHHYLVNPQYQSKGGDVDKPCFTLIARMDKAPPYLVQVESEDSESRDLAILIFPEDSETMKKIKLFMAAYGITDIYMRMLRVDELLAIQGFPEGYILKGTKTQQKKFIGNAVEVNMGKALIQAQAKALITAKSDVA